MTQNNLVIYRVINTSNSLMDKQVEKIRTALSRIPGDAESGDESEITKALSEIDSSLNMLKNHPHSEGIQSALAQTATQLDEEDDSKEGLTSQILHRLTNELNEYEDAYPGATLLVSRLANALAVYGL